MTNHPRSHGAEIAQHLQHHHNSRRFLCECGRKIEWARRHELICPCGIIHWKDRKNWRGEGWTLSAKKEAGR